MSDGHMDIIVYSYLGQLKRTIIGHPYVTDKDDWDRGLKQYKWAKSAKGFSLNEKGEIVMEGDM